jgi:hypothetical protein
VNLTALHALSRLFEACAPFQSSTKVLALCACNTAGPGPGPGEPYWLLSIDQTIPFGGWRGRI